MPEDQIQPDLKQQDARPSDAEIAHAPNEGGASPGPGPSPGQRTSHADETQDSPRG